MAAISGSYSASFALISVTVELDIELEAIVLSRDIPGAMRFVVDPIVRCVSRNALLTSVLQTEEAVCGSSPMSPGLPERRLVTNRKVFRQHRRISPSRLQAFIDSAPTGKRCTIREMKCLEENL